VNKLLDVKKLVLLSTIVTLAALALMVVSILVPNPFLLVLAMSVGQGLGALSLALYLLAIVLDLQGVAPESVGERERSGA
jgi:hypothetical protein